MACPGAVSRQRQRCACWLGVTIVASGVSGCAANDAPELVVSTTFSITQMFGTNPSFLQAYIGQQLAIEVRFSGFAIDHTEATTCTSSTARLADAPRLASGSTAAAAQREVLDPLVEDWQLTLEVCDDPRQSTITLGSTINAFNLSFGCGVVPTSAQRLGPDGLPQFSSFTATRCSATILDVVNAYTIGNADFAMMIDAR
jgi:hypothetical protein